MIEKIIIECYEKWYRSFYKYVYDHGGSREDAEDAFQEGLFLTLRAIKNGASPDDLGAYLFTAAKHAYWEEQKNRSRLAVRMPLSPEPDLSAVSKPDLEFSGIGESQKHKTIKERTDPNFLPDAQVHFSGFKSTLDTCLNKLKRKAKEILTLTIEGFSDKEIAEKLELDDDYIKVARHKARRELKDLLKREGYFFPIAIFVLKMFL